MRDGRAPPPVGKLTQGSHRLRVTKWSRLSFRLPGKGWTGGTSLNRPIGPSGTEVPNAPSTSDRAKVFVSYSRKDLDFAQMLCGELIDRGFDAFLDKTDIAPGEPWKERLAALIAAADTVVYVVSPDSATSAICAWELDESARLGKRVIPIVTRQVSDDVAPAALGRLNYIFCTRSDDRDAALMTLEQALRTDLGWVREHTRLGGLALRWSERGRAKWTCLRGADLEAAERWLDRRPADANAPTALHQDFVRASRRAATGRQRAWIGGALIVALIATGLAVFAEINRREAQQQRIAAEAARQEAETQRKEAEAQKRVAERNFASARQTVDGLIFNIAQGLKNVAGMRVETVRRILETTRATVDKLSATAPDDKRLLRIRAAMLLEFAITYLSAGDLKDALSTSTESLAILRRLAAQDPGDAQAQRDVATSLMKLGDIRMRGGDNTGALAAYEESLGICRRLAARDPADAEIQADLATSLEKISVAKLHLGDQAGALVAHWRSVCPDGRSSAKCRSRAGDSPGWAGERRRCGAGADCGLHHVELATHQKRDQTAAGPKRVISSANCFGLSSCARWPRPRTYSTIEPGTRSRT